MIERLSGTLAAVELTEIVVDVHGVGYAVSVPMSTYDRLPRVGQPVTVLTHLAVREDALQLYGFATAQERALFRLLMTVSGIGPKTALNVLSCISVEAFCRAVAAADMKALVRISGIGKKSAERLVVELRERVAGIEPSAGLGAAAGAGALSAQAQDAIAALETLGFRTETARKVVQTLCQELPAADQSAENLIRRALATLNR
ncbi:MAG: Holliday junction ATP-dependent DNA helicase RuvA [Lentisphaerae bacterium ADurb.BinA184]|nr:MAG: Holliday junction ATP-dependent DNA helicase RuvA [Lentisphaerae bacterium ADurb.BinA184]